MGDDDATESQLAYLRRLGARLPPDGLTKREASDLIDATKDNRELAGARDLALARRFGVEVTRFASKAAIFTRIVEALFYEERWDDLYRWYVWRIHRVTFDREHQAGIEDPFDARLDAAVKALTANEKWKSSVKRAAKFSPTGFRWFGELHGAVGDSERTFAYTEAVQVLRAARPDLVRAARTTPPVQSRNNDRLEPAIAVSYRPATPSDMGEPARASDGSGWLMPLAVIVAVLAVSFLLA